MAYSLILLLLSINILLPLALAGAIWRGRATADQAGAMAGAMALMMLAIAWWGFAFLLELTLTDEALKLLAYRAKFIGIVSLPVVWLLMATQYVGLTGWLARRRLAELLALPCTTLLLIATSGMNDIMWSGYMLESAGPFTYIASEPAGWFWVHSAYSYVLLLGGAALLFRRFMSAPRLYRAQLTALLVSLAVPLMANALVLLGTVQLDITPFGFTVTGVAIWLALRRFQFLDLAPVARDAVIDRMVDGMIVLDSRARIVDINPAARALLGDNAADPIGQHIRDAVPLLSARPELAERFNVAQPVQDEIALGAVDSADAAQRWLEVRMSPLLDRAGQLNARIVVLRDITARKRAEAQINAQNEALRVANRDLTEARAQAEAASVLKSQFLATMSHELRTPLNAIIGYSQLQVGGMAGPMTEKQLEFQNRTLVNAQHLLSLINEVLDISKIEAGRMELTERPFNPRECLAAIHAQNRVLAETKGLEFVLTLGDDLPTALVGDVGRVNQIIINLVANAIKFTDTGRVTLDSRLGEDGAWQISVADTGAGIPAHLQEVIFDEFRQVAGGLQRGGTGLGLAITRKLVLMMGGGIRLHSEVGEGSTFVVSLPLPAPQDAPDAAPAEKTTILVEA